MLSKTNVEYLTMAWPIVTGCKNWETGICGGGGKEFYCWAKRITERFPDKYPNGFAPTFHSERILEPIYKKKPARIGVAFMGDAFGDWAPREWVEAVLDTVALCPQHTFIFLTKCPWNLRQYNPWPKNCWVGASATGERQFLDALNGLALTEANVRFISIEPFLARIPGGHIESLPNCFNPNWLILGSATNPYRPPKKYWIEEIEDFAQQAGIPVFEKNNLAKLLQRPLRQEYPITFTPERRDGPTKGGITHDISY